MKITNTVLSLLTTTLLVSDQILPSLGQIKSRPRTGRRNRHLASNEDLWMSEDVKNCLEEPYETAVVFDHGHLFLAAVPNKDAPDCPTVLTDNGPVMEDNDHKQNTLAWKYLVPHVTVEGDAEEDILNNRDILFFDHTITLSTFVDAVKDLSSEDKYGISKSSYDMIENNCATHMFNVAKKIGLDYKEPETSANIVTYVGKSLAVDKEAVMKIREAYLDKNPGFFQNAKFGVWNWYVGDEGMARHLVKSYIMAGP